VIRKRGDPQAGLPRSTLRIIGNGFATRGGFNRVVRDDTAGPMQPYFKTATTSPGRTTPPVITLAKIPSFGITQSPAW
jgi:hypothetical protein